MRCEDCQEALSARLDGEDGGASDADIDDHLGRCAGCGVFLHRAGDLHRSIRVRPAEHVPDLTSAILASRGRTQRVEVLRHALLAIAATNLLLAVPGLIGTGSHSGRDLAAFGVALSTSLLYAAWRPEHATGMLPMGAALTAAVAVSAAVDIAQGEVHALTESPHVLELLGIGLLWLLHRTQTSPRPEPSIS